MDQFKEQRDNDRYQTEIEVNYYIPYDVQLKVDYQKMIEGGQIEQAKHQGMVTNISADGLRILSPEKIPAATQLILEVHIPKSKQRVLMLAETRWSKQLNAKGDFSTGVLVLKVDGRLVEETIGVDEQHAVVWSVLLDKILGNLTDLHSPKFR